MANLINVNQIRCDGSDIGLMKLDGVIVYQKKELTSEDFYVEYTIDSRYSSNAILNAYYYYNESDRSITYLGLPSFNIIDDNDIELSYNSIDCQTEITLNDGTITTDNSILCGDIAKIKIWYPTTIINGSSVDTLGIKFNNPSNNSDVIFKTINYIETSKFTNMSYMFYDCGYLTTLENANNWNTRNVTDMSYMFYGCNSLTKLSINNWNTRNVIDMSYMFYGCYNLASLGMIYWNTSNVTNMQSMFRGCNRLTSLDLNNWDTSRVTDMNHMFYVCESLTSLDLSNWNTSKVTNMRNMFYGCDQLTSLDLSNWNTNRVTDISSMFANCTALHTLRLDNCSIYTINKIITSYKFPTGTISGVTRTIYCKEENAAELTPPTGWVFRYID